VVAEYAFGHANLATGEKLTPRHRFRSASHSKSFTAAGIMKLRERRKLRLDDPVGQYVKGLHPQVAETTIAQILSHSAGLTRDGAASGQYSDRRPFLGAEELLADLKSPPTIEPNTRFKYSNHGFGLLGLVIEAITGEPYRVWIEREIVEATDLRETQSDMPIAKWTPFARGHTPRLPVGRRLVVPGEYLENAIRPAGGFISTAADVARFFAQLSPDAKRSVLSAGSRREMSRRHWRNPHASLEGYYGLGIMSGTTAGWDWFGHSGGLQGYISRTCVIPRCDVTITILTNATDGWAGFWIDGAMQILRAFATHGAPKRRVRDWTGRWWSPWGATDLVPMGNIVMPPTRTPSIHSWMRRKSRSPAVTPAGSHWPPGMEAMAKPCAAPATRPALLPKSGSPAAKEREKRPWRRRWSADTDHANGGPPANYLQMYPRLAPKRP
jgi:CubicO group peptidase (beta-lactamase class C family)